MQQNPFGTDGSHEGFGSAAQGSGIASSASRLITVKLRDHNVAAFSCPRYPEAETYLKNDAAAHSREGHGQTYVCPCVSDSSKIDGYYHLASSRMIRTDLSELDQAGVPEVPISVQVITYLGRDVSTQPGFGFDLIYDASLRSILMGGTWGITLFAANRKLIEYYQKHGGFTLTNKYVKYIAKEDNGGPAQNSYQMYASHKTIVGDNPFGIL